MSLIDVVTPVITVRTITKLQFHNFYRLKKFFLFQGAKVAIEAVVGLGRYLKLTTYSNIVQVLRECKLKYMTVYN